NEVADSRGRDISKRNRQASTFLHPCSGVRRKLPDLVDPNSVRNVEAAKVVQFVVKHAEATWQNTASSGRPISTGDRSNNIGNWIVTENTTCRGRSRRLRTTHAIDVIGSSIIENAASHVVYQIVRISRRLCGPGVGHRIIFKRTCKFAATAVEGAAAHGVKLPVSREIHAHEADSGTWEILAERPEAARRGSRRRRTRCSTAS